MASPSSLLKWLWARQRWWLGSALTGVGLAIWVNASIDPGDVAAGWGPALVRGRSAYWAGMALTVVGMCHVMHLVARETKRAERLKAGQCAECGYDLRASPDRCPECGAPVSLTR